MRTYRTIQGDTWDIIAYREYKNIGAERLLHCLIDANPEHVGTVIFPAGVVLNVPDIDIPKSDTLPPWVD
mgnify:CR=1 FL=1